MPNSASHGVPTACTPVESQTPGPGVIKTCLAALAHRRELLMTLVLLTRYLPSFARVEFYRLHGKVDVVLGKVTTLQATSG